MVVAGTANLFSQRPGELPAEHLAAVADEHGDDAFVKVVVTSVSP